MVFQYIKICQVPREVLKTVASSLGFQHLPWHPANVNAWKTMFDTYNIAQGKTSFNQKVLIFFLFQGTYNKYPQHMFLWRN